MMQAAVSAHGFLFTPRPAQSAGGVEGASHAMKNVSTVRRSKKNRLVIGVLPQNQSINRASASTNEEADIISVQELADGSVIYVFGASVKEESTSSGSTMDSAVGALPHVASGSSHVPRRWTSEFQKKSPIRVSATGRRRRTSAEEVLRMDVGSPTTASVPGQEQVTWFDEAQRIKGDGDSGGVSGKRLGVPRRFPSFFLKKSPIPESVRKVVRLVWRPEAARSSENHLKENDWVEPAMANFESTSKPHQLFGVQKSPSATQETVVHRHQDWMYNPAQGTPIAAMAKRTSPQESGRENGDSSGRSKSRPDFTQTNKSQRSSGANVPERRQEGNTLSFSGSGSYGAGGSLSSKVKSASLEGKDSFSHGKESPLKAESKPRKVSPSPPDKELDKNSRPLRPKSMYVKVSPIPPPGIPNSSLVNSQVEPEAVKTETETKEGSVLVQSPLRRKSKFVKKSPVPSKRSARAVSVEGVATNGAKKLDTEGGTETLQLQVLPLEDKAVSRSRDFSSESTAHETSPGSLIAKEATAQEGPQTAAEPAPLSTTGVTLADIDKSTAATTATPKDSQMTTNVKGKDLATSDSLEIISGEGSDEKIGGVEDLNSYKLADLKTLAKSRGLKGYSKLKKGDLIELLRSSE